LFRGQKQKTRAAASRLATLVGQCGWLEEFEVRAEKLVRFASRRRSAPPTPDAAEKDRAGAVSARSPASAETARRSAWTAGTREQVHADGLLGDTHQAQRLLQLGQPLLLALIEKEQRRGPGLVPQRLDPILEVVDFDRKLTNDGGVGALLPHLLTEQTAFFADLPYQVARSLPQCLLVRPQAGDLLFGESQMLNENAKASASPPAPRSRIVLSPDRTHRQNDGHASNQ
jgi:hypothetical protein